MTLLQCTQCVLLLGTECVGQIFHHMKTIMSLRTAMLKQMFARSAI